MKRILIMLVVCLLLCGCGPEPETGETMAPTQPEAQPTGEPAGWYEPGSAVETATGGAVRRYPLPIPDACAMAWLGGELLVFSGREATTLTRLTGENLAAVGQIRIQEKLNPEDPTLRVTEAGISYFSRETGETVLLDENLQEVERIALPGDAVGIPLLSSDRQSLYYCTEDSVRVLQRETGVCRLLLETGYPGQSLEGLYDQDTVLRCRLREENGHEEMVFLSGEDGRILFRTREEFTLTTYENRCYALSSEGAMQVLVFGEGERQMLLPRDITAAVLPLEAAHAAVTAARSEEGTLCLEYYRLSDGRRVSSLELDDCGMPLSILAAPEGEAVYLLCHDEIAGGEVIYRWAVADLPVEDATVYTCPRYTPDAPDTEGLAACRAYASELEARYGLEILLYTDATANQPRDFSLEAEYQVPLIRRELETLARLLKAFPEGFLPLAAENTEADRLRLALVRSIAARPGADVPETVPGIHYWISEEPYIALTVGSLTESSLYHQLYHAIESRIFAKSQALYEWNGLNPETFSYDYSYTCRENRGEDDYLTGEGRAFIDSYAMTFPNEDRARVLEYAMIAGNEAYFTPEIMQQKLRTLCLGIREAFGLSESGETYLWEQYLAEPLAERSE